MMALNSASSSSYDVRIRQAIFGSTDRTSRQTSTPLPSGSRPSRNSHVGPQRRYPPGRLSCGTGLTDDIDASVRLHEGAQALPNDLVVVEEEHPDGLSLRCLVVRHGSLAFVGWRHVHGLLSVSSDVFAVVNSPGSTGPLLNNQTRRSVSSRRWRRRKLLACRRQLRM
jgi:hypothetical protein